MEAPLKLINMQQVHPVKIKKQLGKNVAGNTTKIHLIIDSDSLSINLILSCGEIHDRQVTKELIENLLHSEYVIANKDYDTEKL
ncbi:hypothetical protein A9G24_08785 [Gilliamella sp. App6-5]|uniref:transposase n=1 Tax=Gilliamella sp. App6-5 TaxID=3120232 RepID=UPI00080E5D9C|nr:transposase [Gilliamella apicola]OCG12210.1 hypothetical protein A9G24_08785 [Gilliamella apicola]